MESTMQNVWRTMSSHPTCGWFVWEVIEVVGEIDEHYLNNTNLYTEVINGYVVIACYHTFDADRARELYIRDYFDGKINLV